MFETFALWGLNLGKRAGKTYLAPGRIRVNIIDLVET